MKKFDVNKHYDELRQLDDVIFSYKGQMNVDLLDEILEHMSEKLVDTKGQVYSLKRVHIIAVEILQNLFHHYETYNSPDGQESTDNLVVFILGKEEDAFFIQSGNFVSHDRATFLQSKIEEVNGLSPEELRKLYREILSNGNFSAHGGAGLGILDIARKSAQPIIYQFKEYREDRLFFELKVRIPAVD
ncbi:SiaB family protein kinase [Algivirga pacifica]|uniref:SiaB family protein kinase n=1 Tax=Algivirga pacifica TaxID=1162670 RepID=UPI0031E9B2AD